MNKSAKSVFKPKPISGFPEWLPEVRIIELQWLDHIRTTFESYGFCSIETPSVEELDVLVAKGEINKEIYTLERLHKDKDDNSEARLALHFDQTVPLARYVAQHFNDLIFPFKRYQIQRVWRGERPQAGRFREFYQCDIDVINIDNLPQHFDAEMPAIIWKTLTELPGMQNETIQLRVSNRKILLGLLNEWGVQNQEDITRSIDKLEHIGFDKVKALLIDYGMHENRVQELMALAAIRADNSQDLSEKLKNISHLNQEITDGCNELYDLLNRLNHLPKGAITADLSIVRGLDYYTGTVYETVFTDDPSYGSICSGGRYDDLASGYINKKLPGVGISIGFSRLFAKLLHKGALPLDSKTPAEILIILPNAEQETIARQTASILRANNYKVEMYHAPQKINKQLSYAERKGIPYVWFPPFEAGQAHEVKNMKTGHQAVADPQNWVLVKESKNESN